MTRISITAYREERMKLAFNPIRYAGGIPRKMMYGLRDAADLFVSPGKALREGWNMGSPAEANGVGAVLNKGMIGLTGYMGAKDLIHATKEKDVNRPGDRTGARVGAVVGATLGGITGGRRSMLWGPLAAGFAGEHLGRVIGRGADKIRSSFRSKYPLPNLAHPEVGQPLSASPTPQAHHNEHYQQATQ